MKRREFLKTAAIGNMGLLSLDTTFKNSSTESVPGSKIKIGQIGISHEHAFPKFKTLLTLPNIYDFVGIVNDRNSKAARFVGNPADDFSSVEWMTEDELFNIKGLQAVMVETANADLVPTAIRCMEHGVAIHMDKPGGQDIDLFKALMEGCQKKDIIFQMGYMFRNNPAIQFCQKVIQEGWLGNIFEIQGNMSHDYGGGEPYERYLSNFKGGIMFNLGCHIIDVIILLFGAPQKVTSFLETTKLAPDNSKNNCLAILEYPHAIASVSACNLKIDGINQRYLRIFGSNGSIELSPLERFDGRPLQLELLLKDGNDHYNAGTHIIDTGVQSDRYSAQLVELSELINRKIGNPYSYEYEYLVQKIVMTASGFKLNVG